MSAAALLSVQGLAVHFRARRALEDVSFEVHAGETLAVVGESGAGKSTLARALVRLVPIERGALRFAGVDLTQARGRRLRELRGELQIVFQDPLASLDPRMTVGETLEEPLVLIEERARSARGAPAARTGRAERARQVNEALAQVGLDASFAARYPRELSGGQCQRVAIARAMMSSPRLLVCDEPVSALDVSIQGQIVNLLADVQRARGTAIILISHNLAVVRQLAHRVLVLLEGRVLESGSAERLLAAPGHPYTRALIASVPTLQAANRIPDGGPRALTAAAGAPTRAAGGVAGAVAGAGAAARAARAAPSGCVYAARCPWVQPLCERVTPVLELTEEAHSVACHRWREIASI